MRQAIFLISFALLAILLVAVLGSDRPLQGQTGQPPGASASLVATVTPGIPLSVHVYAPKMAEVGEFFPVVVTVTNSAITELLKGKAGVAVSPQGLEVTPKTRHVQVFSPGETILSFKAKGRKPGAFTIQAFAEARMSQGGAKVSAWSEPVALTVYKGEGSQRGDVYEDREVSGEGGVYEDDYIDKPHE